MARTDTRPRRQQPHRGEEHAFAAVSELHAILPFDAIQLLRHEPRRSEVREVLRIGYGPDAAWALQHLFAQKYRVGFTHALSPNDGLPPAISSVRSEFRDDFVESRIYRDYLQTNGYRDGMSMELFLGQEYVGIAHFSAKRPLGFSQESRRAASSVRGLLAALIAGQPQGGDPRSLAGPAFAGPAFEDSALGGSGSGQSWYALSALHRTAALGPAPIPAFLESPAFRTHLEQFRDSGMPSVRHLWPHGGRLLRLELRMLPQSAEIVVGVAEADPDSYHRLSAQELRVLALLCAGHDDAAIGGLLHLSRRTVESHVLSARRKLGAKNRVEAVVRAITTASYLPDPEHCPIGSVLGVRGAPPPHQR